MRRFVALKSIEGDQARLASRIKGNGYQLLDTDGEPDCVALLAHSEFDSCPDSGHARYRADQLNKRLANAARYQRAAPIGFAVGDVLVLNADGTRSRERTIEITGQGALTAQGAMITGVGTATCVSPLTEEEELLQRIEAERLQREAEERADQQSRRAC